MCGAAVEAEHCASKPVVQVARARSALALARRVYCDAIGLAVLGSLADREGFDGLIRGNDGASWNSGLAHQLGAAPVRPSNEPPILRFGTGATRLAASIRRMRDSKYAPLCSNNRYWDGFGSPLEDHDSCRSVLVCLAWPAAGTHAVEPAA
jgi:hypothetical protein